MIGLIGGATKGVDTGTKKLNIQDLETKYQDDTPIVFGDTNDIKNDQVATIRGEITDDTGNKYLEANKITIHKTYTHRIKGKITAIETINDGLTKNITVEGQKYQLTRQAVIQNLKDGQDKDVFKTLANGDMVSVGYYIATGDGTNIITKLQRTRVKAGEENTVIAHAQ